MTGRSLSKNRKDNIKANAARESDGIVIFLRRKRLSEPFPDSSLRQLANQTGNPLQGKTSIIGLASCGLGLRRANFRSFTACGISESAEINHHGVEGFYLHAHFLGGKQPA